MNKKGQLNSLLLLGMIIMVVIVGGIVIAIGSGILTYTGNILNDVTSTIGVIGDTNVSSASDMSVGIVNKGLQMLKWGSGVLMFLALLGILMFAISIRLNPSGFMIGLYIMMVIVFVISAIYMSNIYETFLTGSDDIALELQQMPIINFIIIFMPHIITALAFIGGIIIFSGLQGDYL